MNPTGAELPHRVAELCDRWGLARTPEPPRRGFGGVAVFVTRADGSPAVLKVTTATASRGDGTDDGTDGGTDDENVVLAAWNGQHAARLLERDDRHHARLVERLEDRSLAQCDDPEQAMGLAGDLARKLAIPPPIGLTRMTDVAPGIAAGLERAGTPPGLDDRAVRRAVDTFRTLGADQPDSLLHGDLQGGNILRTAAGDWAAIDPLGLVGEVALEALTLVRDRWAVLSTAHDPRAELLCWLRAYAEAAGAPLPRVIEWTHARCVRAVCQGVDDDDGRHALVATLL